MSIVKAGTAVLGVVGASLLAPHAAHRPQVPSDAVSSSELLHCAPPTGSDASVSDACAAAMQRSDFAISYERVSIGAIFGHESR